MEQLGIAVLHSKLLRIVRCNMVQVGWDTASSKVYYRTDKVCENCCEPRYATCADCGEDGVLSSVTLTCYDVGVDLADPYTDCSAYDVAESSTVYYCQPDGSFMDEGGGACTGYVITCNVYNDLRSWYLILGFVPQFINSGAMPLGTISFEVTSGAFCKTMRYLTFE